MDHNWEVSFWLTAVCACGVECVCVSGCVGVCVCVSGCVCGWVCVCGVCMCACADLFLAYCCVGGCVCVFACACAHLFMAYCCVWVWVCVHLQVHICSHSTRMTKHIYIFILCWF